MDVEDPPAGRRGIDVDRRWVRCRRPLVMVGGELTLEALELSYNPVSGFYKAPVQALANGGHPAVVSYKKAGGIGHVAVIRPGEIGDKGNPMAQAGARNVNHTHVYSIFRRGTAVDLWGHD